jgi:hypothetical protein
MEALYWKNDTLLELRSLRNEVTKQFVNNATVTAVIKQNSDGSEIGGATWPLTLSYVAASNGLYRGIVESDVNVEVGDLLDLEITVTAPGNLDGFFKLPLLVKERRDN